MRRPLMFLLVAILVIGACGDDDDAATDADAPGSTAVTTTTTVVPDIPADDPPDDDGEASPDEGLGDPLVFVADLAADAEVPGPGDTEGVGRFEAESDIDGRLCIDMLVEGLSADVTGTHIHEAAEGATGPIAVPIGTPTSSDGDVDTWTDVCVEVDDELLGRMTANPENFYANVHTADFADGAIRGQLVTGSIFDLRLS